MLAADSRNSLQRQGIVEITSISGVDSERETAPQIAIPLFERRIDIEYSGPRLSKGAF